MTDDELCGLSLVEAASLVRHRKVSAQELVLAALRRTERVGHAVDPYTNILATSAEREARALDDRLAAGEQPGPLHGIPVTLKDNIEVAGAPTTAGSTVLRDWVPTTDAEVAARLRAAGAVIVAKANLWEFAGPRHNEPAFGVPRNPWSADRDPGGSSSGSAVSVAARLCFASIGTDGGGSVRVPAAYNGVCGLKPTYDLVDRRGVISHLHNLDHLGPIARSAVDTALVLEAIAGVDLGARTLARASVRGLRVGAVELPADEPVESSVRAAAEAAWALLAGEGATVVPVALPPTAAYASDIVRAIAMAEGAEYYRPLLDTRGDELDPEVRDFFAGGELVTGPQYVRAQRLRRRLTAELRDRFADLDVLVLPTSPIVAHRRGASAFDVDGAEVDAAEVLIRYTSLFNLTGQPALAIPAGFDDDGLPISVQLVGRPFEERTVLRAAAALQRVTDWHLRAPPLP